MKWKILNMIHPQIWKKEGQNPTKRLRLPPGVNNNVTIYCEDTDSQREEDSSQALTIEAEKEDFSDTMMEKMAQFMHKKGLIFAPVPVVSIMKEQVPGRR